MLIFPAGVAWQKLYSFTAYVCNQESPTQSRRIWQSVVPSAWVTRLTKTNELIRRAETIVTSNYWKGLIGPNLQGHMRRHSTILNVHFE